MEIGNYELTLPLIIELNYLCIIYNHFRVGPATDNYWLSISGFTGTILCYSTKMDNSSVHT